MKFWRIAADTPAYSSDDLTGAGARDTGGRWNAKGTALVYASTNRALACLETFAHLTRGASLPLNRYLVEFEVSDAVWDARVSFVASAHVGWDAEPAGRVSLDWGTAWVSGGASLLAVVPSVIVPEELNVLINPTHADIGGVGVRKVRKWTFDQRFDGR